MNYRENEINKLMCHLLLVSVYSDTRILYNLLSKVMISYKIFIY